MNKSTLAVLVAAGSLVIGGAVGAAANQHDSTACTLAFMKAEMLLQQKVSSSQVNNQVAQYQSLRDSCIEGE
jgi:hypothetical protein